MCAILCTTRAVGNPASRPRNQCIALFPKKMQVSSMAYARAGEISELELRLVTG
jgi:hypothetical protein